MTKAARNFLLACALALSDATDATDATDASVAETAEAILRHQGEAPPGWAFPARFTIRTASPSPTPAYRWPRI